MNNERDKEIQNYLGAIIKYSNKMYVESAVTDKDDLMQAGFIGMLNGLDSFSEEKAKLTGTKKTTYVIQCIFNSILQEANKFYGATSLPHNKRLRLNALKKMLNEGTSKEKIKETLEMDDKEFEELSGLIHLKNSVPISLLLEDEEPTPKDFVTESANDYLKGFGLNDEETQIIKLKLNGMTYNAIADHYNVSRETMRKRIHKIVSRIKKKIRDK